MTDVLLIRLDEPETECIACGADCPKTHGLPMFEGWFLEANDPGEWAGFDACRPCFDAYTAGGIAGLMQHLATLEGNDEAQELVRTWEEMGGRPARVVVQSPAGLPCG